MPTANCDPVKWNSFVALTLKFYSWYFINNPIVLCSNFVFFTSFGYKLSWYLNRNATFLDGEKVNGIHLVTDPKLVFRLKNFLGDYVIGPKRFFPAMWPVHLTSRNISKLETQPHFVIPKPHGTRYLLYVDPSGQIYLENYAQNIFRIDEDHTMKFISSDGQSITDTILDGVITRVADKRPDAGRLTFVIMDATLCRGVSLKQMNIKQRIAFVRVIIYIKINQITIEWFKLNIIIWF